MNMPRSGAQSQVFRALVIFMNSVYVAPKYHVDIRLSQTCFCFSFQVLDKYSPPDHYLPESYTCFFLLKMPRYSSQRILCEKLKYAIHFCKSIDSDDYARIDLTGEQAEEYDTDVEAF